MASDWLPMRLDLLDDPAVIACAAATGLDEYAVVGRLLKLWSWANRNTTDGNASCNAVGVTGAWVDRYCNATGFAAALLAAGWLFEADPAFPGVLAFPKFDRWNSQGAKTRVLTARRVAEHRERKAPESNAERNAPCNARGVTSALTKEEKRREEKSKTPQPPAGGGRSAAEPTAALVPVASPKPTAEAVPIPDALDTPEFRVTWADWLAARRAKRKPVSDRAARGQLSDLAAIGPVNAVACIRESIRNDWQGLFPDKFRGGTGRAPNLFDRGAAQENRMVAQIAEAMAGIPNPDGEC